MSEASQGTRTLSELDRVVSYHVRTYRLDCRLPGGREETREVATSCLRIGSRRGNDLLLDDPAVSRFHAEIVADEHGYRLRDLGSHNGTMVDGYRVHDIYLKPGSLIAMGQCVLRFEPLLREAEVAISEDEHFGPLLGKSAAMRQLFATLERIAPTDFSVLIEGETGTGKELVARALHEKSRRATGPLVVFDAAAAPAHLLESQLFGHAKGAFTGAVDARVGLIEHAEGGTLFLDEIGELPLSLQPKLLRALEQREVTPLGSHEAKAVDFRLVAATNRDLAAEVNLGSFREDLYYRLAVVRLVLPPLRERPEDIPQLVERFVHAFVDDEPRARRIVASIGDWRALRAFPWPGNVRQLRNVVEGSLALAGDQLPVTFDPALGRRPDALPSPSSTPELDRPYIEQRDELLSRFEEAYLQRMLERHDGNISRAAESAGLDRAYFKRLLRKYR
ncbi:MAG TPA: sigma 54-interacting transcriptional regulator [Polyangiaceae bacterium]|jgi:DNA-binding NtrC family response regulator|nr:sigma 54-interacting transcriptional regulator [Polyangiaceae bacterium]